MIARISPQVCPMTSCSAAKDAELVELRRLAERDRLTNQLHSRKQRAAAKPPAYQLSSEQQLPLRTKIRCAANSHDRPADLEVARAESPSWKRGGSSGRDFTVRAGNAERDSLAAQLPNRRGDIVCSRPHHRHGHQSASKKRRRTNL